MKKLAVVICLFVLVSFFVSAQEEKQVLEPSSVELTTLIKISKEVSLVLYPPDLQKIKLVYTFKTGERRIWARTKSMDGVLCVEVSETRTTKKASKSTMLTIQKAGPNLKAAQPSVTALVEFVERPIYQGGQERHPIDPILVTQKVKLNRVHGQFLFSVLDRIDEAVRKQYSQNPEKRSLDVSDLKLNDLLKEDIQVLLTTSVRSFYSKVASKKASVKLKKAEAAPAMPEAVKPTEVKPEGEVTSQQPK